MRIELIKQQNDAILVIFPFKDESDGFSMNFTISRPVLYSLYIKLRDMFKEVK